MPWCTIHFDNQINQKMIIVKFLLFESMFMNSLILCSIYIKFAHAMAEQQQQQQQTRTKLLTACRSKSLKCILLSAVFINRFVTFNFIFQLILSRTQCTHTHTRRMESYQMA